MSPNNNNKKSRLGQEFDASKCIKLEDIVGKAVKLSLTETTTTSSSTTTRIRIRMNRNNNWNWKKLCYDG
jgi:hypothetical protein